jgi:hypothetical protein
MNEASKRKVRHPTVAPFPRRHAAPVVGALLATALISSPAVAVSPAPPPPEFFAPPETGEALWTLCGETSIGRIPLTCSAYVVGASDGVALAATSARPPFCLSPETQADDLAEVVHRYLAAHPQSRGGSAASVVAAALKGAYPCGLREQR